jgi:hypothetical protein
MDLRAILEQRGAEMAKSKGASKGGRGTSPKARKTEGAEPLVSGAEPYRPRLTKAQARAAVEIKAGSRIRLADFRPSITPLTREEKELLIEQARAMLELVYVHLPLKRAIHTIDPLQRLRLLKLHHENMEERAFQSEMINIFIGLRDLHTNYMLPTGYRTKFAFLPFRVEEFYDNQERKFVVSWVSPVSTDHNLKAGMIVTHWNGSPVDLAVARNAEKEAGSNPEARRAQGIEALTLRWLGMSLPPDEDWVTLTYTDGVKTFESKFDWEVVSSSDLGNLLVGLIGGAGQGMASAGWGIDLKTALLQRVRKALFDPQAIQVEEEAEQHREDSEVAALSGLPAAASPLRAETSFFADVFSRFGPVTTPSGTFGYIRLGSFAPKSGDIDGVVRELARILSLLPQTGLILDVRGNGGGYVNFGERILQMLTPRTIVPEPFHLLASAMNLDICRQNQWLNQWMETVAQGIETGASFSQGFPLTSPEECNNVGQVYQGPLVLITDALCYSTTDMFAAGFQDHEIGTIIGVHKNTGAGGANVWDHEDLRGLTLLSNPFLPLPQGAGMRVAIRRSTRVGKRSGVPLEDLGVVPDKHYLMTLNDVLNHNADLIAFAAQELAGKAKQTLRMTKAATAPTQKLKIDVDNIDRLDLMIGDRPLLSRNVTSGQSEINLPDMVPPGSVLLGRGYHSGKLVVSARLLV